VQRRSNVAWDRVLAQTADYIVVPTKGALVPGWVLVVAKEHSLCAGALEQTATASLDEAIAIAKDLIEPKFGPVTLFEHGPVTDGSALGCGVDHLHIHVAPLAFSLRAAFHGLFDAADWNELTGWSGLHAVHGDRIPYVAIQQPGERLGWCRAPLGVRQPLRRAVADGIGVGEQFDYNLHPHSENVVRTVELLAAV
jgi:ATP adenylyltransferase